MSKKYIRTVSILEKQVILQFFRQFHLSFIFISVIHTKHQRNKITRDLTNEHKKTVDYFIYLSIIQKYIPPDKT